MVGNENTPTREVPARRRVSLAFFGLLAGLAALLLFLLQNAIRARGALLRLHMGEPYKQVPLAFDIFMVYAGMAIAGWILVGIPAVLMFPPRVVRRLSWITAAVIGAAIGPLALFADFLLIARGHLVEGWARSTTMLWAYSAGVGMIAFVVYTALIRHSLPTVTSRAANSQQE